MSPSPVIHLVVPAGVDDPLRPSGGNTYDRRVTAALRDAGWCVEVREVAGSWPWAGIAGRDALVGALASLPDASLVLVDGLVATSLPEVMVPAGRRLHVVVLLHMPLGLDDARPSLRRAEGTVLRAASAVIAPSSWLRRWLLDAYALDGSRLHVVHPGVDAARPASGSRSGSVLVSVGALTPGKGHDVLVEALAQLRDAAWRCDLVGALTIEPVFVEHLRRRVREAGLECRLQLTGPLTGSDLDAAYAQADVLVVASRAETYGMVVTEALARGLPVIAADVGGLPEALGVGSDGARPGLLVRSGDATALAEALRQWLGDPDLRAGLRAAALERRAELPGWDEAAERVAHVLTGVAA